MKTISPFSTPQQQQQQRRRSLNVLVFPIFPTFVAFSFCFFSFFTFPYTVIINNIYSLKISSSTLPQYSLPPPSATGPIIIISKHPRVSCTWFWAFYPPYPSPPPSPSAAEQEEQ